MPNETLQYFYERRDVMIDAIRSIVDIESPSFDASASSAVVDLIESLFGETGVPITAERVVADGVGTHLIVRAFAGDGKNTLLLGHTDTVHPIGTAKQNPTRIDDRRLYGCGIFDMKANIVLMAEALRYFAQKNERPSGPLTILLSCDEEVGSHTGQRLVEREAANASRCFVFEPSAAGKVKTGRKGTGVFTLHARGLPAHAGLEPEKGANAITEIARQIEHIHAIAAPEIGTTVNVTTMNGGTTSNVIPEHAVCEIDVRFSQMSEASRVETELNGLTAFDERVTLGLSGEINRPPLERTDRVIELYQMARGVAQSFGYELGETQVGGGSDGNFVAALGVPVLDGLGIMGDGAHRMDEHILIEDIAPRATLVTSLMCSQ